MDVKKQVVGIDVAKDELVVTLGRMFEDFSLELYAYKVFKNKESGFKALLDWTEKFTDKQVKVRFVMEATGVYHQMFAFYLYEHGCDVSIILPNKISNYIRTLEVKTVNDKTCSEAITRFGLERKLDNWERPKKSYKSLQQLTRERGQVVDERSMVKNQLHAELHEAEPNQRSLERLRARINFLNIQEKEIKSDIGQIVKQDKLIKHQVEIISSIPGIGELTAAIILAETNGFEFIRSKKQLSSYAGFDVREKQSGTSIKGKPRISKKGNRSLRKAMYLPSITAVKWDDNFRGIYARIVSKEGIKKKGLVAIQRRLLELSYTILKREEKYDKEFEINKKNRAQIHKV